MSRDTIIVSNNKTPRVSGQYFRGILNARALLWMWSQTVLLMKSNPKKGEFRVRIKYGIRIYWLHEKYKNLKSKICIVVQVGWCFLKLTSWLWRNNFTLAPYWDGISSLIWFFTFLPVVHICLMRNKGCEKQCFSENTVFWDSVFIYESGMVMRIIRIWRLSIV